MRIKNEKRQKVKATLIKVPSAYEAFATLLQKYEEMKPRKTGRDREAARPKDEGEGRKGEGGARETVQRWDEKNEGEASRSS